ncbi:MAG: site-specific integrase [bacterium]|nr:site-specific integrase [bacterium]
MLHWRFEREDDTALRILGDADEVALLNAAEEWYGDQWRAFVFVALRTGGRRSELLRLTWDRVHLDGDEPRVHFANTKGKRDRFVPITPDTVAVLQRLKARTLPDGGPFVALGEHIDKQWRFIVGKAGIKAATLHDLRRTYVTRLVRAGVPLPHVQKLAGHASIQTTLTHYNQVDDADLRAGIEKLRKAAGA